MPPANQEAFFREVDEELRAAQLVGAWKRYGRLIAALLILGLVVLAGALYWQHHRKTAREARAEQFTVAIADAAEGKEPAARTVLTGLAGGDDGYAVAARLTEAGLALAKDDAKRAAELYRSVAADERAPQAFRDLATVRGTAAAFDTLPPAEIVARLKPLAVAGNPWFGSAAEMTALAYLRMNQPAKAAPLFGALAKDKSLPDTLRGRAVRIAGQLGVDGVATSGEAD